MTYEPGVVLVTLTVIVHVAPAPTLPPVKATLVPPDGAVTVPLPQVVEPGVRPIVTPVGSVSWSARPVSAIAPLAVLATVSVSVETLPTKIDDGLNAFVNVTFGAATVSVAVAGAVLVAPCALVMALAGIVLTSPPGVVPVTVTLTVQVAPAATLPPESAIVVAPGPAVTEPAPHVVDALGVPATAMPDGSASETPRLVSGAAPVAVLAIVSCSTDVPPSVMDAGVKLFVKVTGGALLTTSVAVAGLPFVAP